MIRPLMAMHHEPLLSKLLFASTFYNSLQYNLQCNLSSTIQFLQYFRAEHATFSILVAISKAKCWTSNILYMLFNMLQGAPFADQIRVVVGRFADRVISIDIEQPAVACQCAQEPPLFARPCSRVKGGLCSFGVCLQVSAVKEYLASDQDKGLIAEQDSQNKLRGISGVPYFEFEGYVISSASPCATC